jgi:phospholipid/cholesterol/gamma-HCH transport system substrate-binding protein
MTSSGSSSLARRRWTMSREVRVGALVVVAVLVFAAAVFLLGERENFFALKNEYTIRFATVSGLETGNPVQLNGVVVGRVEEVVLPERIEQQELTVRISLDRRFGDRVRKDSLARIKTLGLLGDKYVELTSGSPDEPVIPPGGEVPAAPATDVDRLLASGEDVVDNVAAISISLRAILERMERGEGLLGEMLVDSEEGQRTKRAVVETFESLRSISARIESGEGTIGALVMSDDLADQVETSISGLATAVAAVENGEGPVAALLHDDEMRTQLEKILAQTGEASERWATLMESLEDGDGLVRRLLTDEEYALSLSEDLAVFLANLRKISGQLADGDGSLGKLIQDPQLYEALNDIVVGVEESRLLRWLVRNRQKAGIEKRFEDENGRVDD